MWGVGWRGGKVAGFGVVGRGSSGILRVGGVSLVPSYGCRGMG